jgi:serine/threonine protein kinase/tetratricopeptide (TPR) repeat protein
VIERWQERLARGEAVDPAPEIAARPHLAERLREGFEALRLLEADGIADGAATSLVGRTLGAYRLESVLGAGGMGTVYLGMPAEGARAAARVAVKVLHSHLFDRPGFFKRFLREAEIGRRVRHANVVRTLDADECVDGADRRRFLVMEYVEGRTLRQVLAEDGKLPEALCRHVGREVAAALTAVHAAGAVHRDVKPENVLLTNDHVVKLMDLGVARLSDEAARVSQTGMFVGSLLYAAPEQFAERGELDGRTDLHALGLLLYELATGTHPFQHDDFRAVLRRIADERPRRLGELDPQVSPFFEELVAALLEKDPARRPESADAIARILGEGEESAWWRTRSIELRTEARRPLRRIRIPRETALYGREAELAKLRGLYESAKSGEGRVVLLDGEAGIGKSRLVDEFVGGLVQAGENVNFLFGSYPPGGAATASGAFSTAYREHLGDDEAAVRAALPQTPLLVPAFAALLRGDATPTGAEPLTKDSLRTVFVHATRTFAATRPTIVLIDDLHFAPEEGRALFMSIALAVPGHRVLLVGCTRPGLDETWVRQLTSREQTTDLPVPRLGPKELVRLLGDALRSERLADELAGLIAKKSDGNPFFVFELLRGLKEGQFLAQRPDGTWHTTQVIRDIRVPSSIVELVQARVADLSQDERNALDVASCLGFEFDPLLVGDVLGVPQIPLMQRFAHVEKKHRLVRSAGRRFVFDHHQVQEALYGGLPELLREPYHASIAEAIERRSGAASKEPKEVDGATCVDLAEHFLKGAQGPPALRYLDAALTYLEKGYLNDHAIALAGRALAVPGLVDGKARCELLLRDAVCLDVLGRRDAQVAVLEEARSIADRADDLGLRAQVRSALSSYHVHVSQYSAALSAARDAQELAGSARNLATEAAAMGHAGTALASLGRFPEAQAQHERLLGLAREIGDRRLEGQASGGLGCVSAFLGRFADALTLFERELAIAQEIGHRGNQAAARGHLGQVFYSTGRFAEALTQSERAVALAREVGDRRLEGGMSGSLGIGFSALGRFAEASALHERHVALAREVGDRQGEAMAEANLGVVLHGVGRFVEAHAHFERFLALAREIGDSRCVALAFHSLACVWLQLGHVVQARTTLEETLARSRALGARPLEGAALLGLGDLADEEEDAVRALAMIEASLALRREIGDGTGIADSLIALGDLRRRTGDPEGAQAAVEEGVSRLRTQGRASEFALALAVLANLPGGDPKAAEEALVEANQDCWQSVATHFLVWQATRDRAHLAKAKRLLDDLLAKNADCRESMLANVRLHREIAAAAHAQGI